MNNNKMMQQINELSSYVLDKTIKKEKACLYMSAYLCALINDNMKITARLISGSLVIRSTKIFSHEPILPIITSGSNYTGEWDGHAWVEVAGYICDLSIFCTIFSKSTSIELQNVFMQTFDRYYEFLIAPREKLEAADIFYKECEELGNEQIDILIHSGIKSGILVNPE
ncbi:hypothetical protein APR64_09195 [Enterobacter hormaechei]|uniref:hypothetical protein n=1 Tax=Enterobacter TaxID=547 RepID=UPI00073F41D1|nr:MULTISPECIES: hypothetical protein [Enterobacter]ELT0443091.1 hypothetical protein [Enterobacter hormaechei subsp. xiangfangensis]ELX8362388.1 hypothetical protein [Enterobacter hormaechei]KUH53032.1 hypothetical protein APR64_09195 [Enterobacter hormaechei]MBT1744887.1 hypothetical protein [Enterobacter hormaechei subsp. xiangfangensis]MCE1211221.1 hypothetical protein [Enterobacter hormaechei]